MVKKRILFLSQHFITLYAFRRELIERLCAEGHEVFLSLPASDENEYFSKLGCTIVPTDIDRRGVNPFKDLKLITFYRKMIPQIDPDIIFSYTIKPNVYGCFATNQKKRKNGKPFRQICNVTGTGATFLEENVIAMICRVLYRHSVKKCYKVFFQNSGDRDMFVKNGMVKDNWSMLPGSGVNLQQFSFCPLPEGDVVNFIFIGRVMKLKGIDEFYFAFGTYTYQSAVITINGSKYLHIGFADIDILWSNIVAIGVSLIAMLLVHFFLNKTKFGSAMRAAAMDPLAAESCGISVVKTRAVTWGIMSALGALGGCLTGPLFGISAGIGIAAGAKGNTGAVLGGYGNMYGAIIGGLIIGLVETVFGFICSPYQTAFTNALFLVFILLLPRGITNEKAIEEG